MTKLVEVEPGRWRIERVATPPARSPLPCPYLISDEMPAIEQVDGRMYTSKAAFRAVGRAHGLTEVGNERPAPKQRSTDSKQVKAQRRHALQRAVERVRAGTAR